MLSYVVRRLLYSVVVLVAASFILFTFVSVSGDPLAFIILPAFLRGLLDVRPAAAS